MSHGMPSISHAISHHTLHHGIQHAMHCVMRQNSVARPRKRPPLDYCIAPKARYRKRGRKMTLNWGGYLNERRVCALRPYDEQSAAPTPLAPPHRRHPQPPLQPPPPPHPPHPPPPRPLLAAQRQRQQQQQPQGLQRPWLSPWPWPGLL